MFNNNFNVYFDLFSYSSCCCTIQNCDEDRKLCNIFMYNYRLNNLPTIKIGGYWVKKRIINVKKHKKRKRQSPLVRQFCFQSIINKQMSIIVKSKMKKWKGNQKVTTFLSLASTSSNQKYHHNCLSISLQMLPSTNCLQIAPTILLQLHFLKLLIFR